MLGFSLNFFAFFGRKKWVFLSIFLFIIILKEKSVLRRSKGAANLVKKIGGFVKLSDEPKKYRNNIVNYTRTHKLKWHFREALVPLWITNVRFYDPLRHSNIFEKRVFHVF